MRVVIVGATGTIGTAVVHRLSERHEIVRVGHRHGDYQVDLTRIDSINALYESVGPFDAVVSTAGVAKMAAFDELDEADYQVGLRNKLMGQVNLVRLGRRFIRDRGSFTLTSGVLSHEPMKGSASISMVNAGLEGFVRAAALELPRGIRLNAVSPPWVTETLQMLHMDASIGLPASEVARAYIASVEGSMTGRIIDPRTLHPA
jgi:NAD(P)-dependent dehydrogenase (short-subunit alcohol dehydrogenase family)